MVKPIVHASEFKYRNPIAAKSGDVVIITATFSEPLADTPVINLERTGTDVAAAAVMTKVDATQYTYTWTVGPGDGLMTAVMSLELTWLVMK